MSSSPTSSLTFTTVFAGLFLVWALKTVIQLIRALRDPAIRSSPGRGVLLYNPFGGLSLATDRWSPMKWRFHDYHDMFNLYAHYGSTILSSVVLWSGERVYWIGDGDAIKTIANKRDVFGKDMNAYEPVLNIWGSSIITTEGAEWKAHKGIVKTAFNEANNALVWKETSRIMSEWVTAKEKEKAGEFVDVDLLSDMTVIAMQVIQAAAFGRRPSWAESSSKLGHDTGKLMPFEESLSASADNLIQRSLTPNWVIDIAEKVDIPQLKMIRQSFKNIEAHMMDLVRLARVWVDQGEGSEEKRLDAALLRNLVEANSKEDGKKLNDGELLTNTFIFLVAGHETSAHSLCFMVAFLAIYPDIQRKVREEVLSVANGDDSSLDYKDMSKLIYTTAVFHESSRLCTITPRFGRVALSDTILRGKRFKPGFEDYEEFPVHIKRGSQVIMDLSSVHMNRRSTLRLVLRAAHNEMLALHWGSDVDEFKPERFIDTDTYRWPRDAFVAFSAGPRSCIGRTFATTEVLCIVANLVKEYDILPPADLRGKSFEEQKSITEWKTWITTTPSNARVSLRRRTRSC
ncbi:hypothetical protein VNI00_010340 [Paramarasmius palmivorus]|uniref:Cytochrome P450 n=1 Tax=Paramarasmius palmivorus TaxID=297713 RepID=A0AAW0CKV0_9AGAR